MLILDLQLLITFSVKNQFKKIRLWEDWMSLSYEKYNLFFIRNIQPNTSTAAYQSIWGSEAMNFKKNWEATKCNAGIRWGPEREKPLSIYAGIHR